MADRPSTPQLREIADQQNLDDPRDALLYCIAGHLDRIATNLNELHRIGNLLDGLGNDVRSLGR